MSSSPLRVLLYMKASKYPKMAYASIEAAAPEHECVVSKLELDGDRVTASLAACDVLIIKATDDIVDGEQRGNAAALARSARLTQLLADAPHVVLIDAIATQRLVLSRATLYNTLARVSAVPALAGMLEQPRFVVLDAGVSAERTAEQLAELRYPLLAKTDLACGTAESHHMMAAQTAAELAPWLAERRAHRIVVQEFVSHGAVVYKCFAIGDRLGVVARPSIDAPAANAALAFDSQVALGGAKHTNDDDNGDGDLAAVTRVANEVRAALAALYGFSVFGFDLLAVEQSGGRFAIVDVNYFPGFKEMVADGSFAHVLLEHAKTVHRRVAHERDQ